MRIRFHFICLVTKHGRRGACVAHTCVSLPPPRALLKHDIHILELNRPSLLLCDSKSAVDMAYDPVSFKKTKHILRAAEYLRDVVAKQHVRVKHLSGDDMVADILTKSLPRPRFLEMIKLLDTLFSFDFLAALK